ncbi:hypothetical protein Cgig2_032761 [Carnegiea gigantea]|uniref:RRM domain-containing protein n=1 Tax=Carnegiea gigantea TaxID=171969 RepID=A0A9Q1QIY1_9CARY|nr:hypothetical protein Cgig2_032761 [Carnegiea gigantea]
MQAMRNQRKAKATEFDASLNEGNDADFLKMVLLIKSRKEKSLENKATVLYVGRIPHGFYEDEMEGFFKQFGTIKRLKIARNRKAGEPTKIEGLRLMNSFKGKKKQSLLATEGVYHFNQQWRGVNRPYKPVVDFVLIERKKHNTDRTLEEHQKLLITILKQDKKRRKKLEAAGVEYECPSIEGANQPIPKKIRFDFYLRTARYSGETFMLEKLGKGSLMQLRC